MFRIVQEAVSNIVKHSEASCAKVTVVKRATSVEIRVEDNGMGFSSDASRGRTARRHGAGLVGIRERARILGGQVEIHSSAETGTTVAVTLPLERRDAWMSEVRIVIAEDHPFFRDGLRRVLDRRRLASTSSGKRRTG